MNSLKKPKFIFLTRSSIGFMNRIQSRFAIFVLLFLLMVTSSTSIIFPGKLHAADEKKFYDPLETKIEGWTILVDPQLMEKKNAEIKKKAFAALANHLQRVKYILPKEKAAQLQKLRIWLELNNPKLGNMQYHPGKQWLIDNGHDPRLVKHVHIPRAKALYARRTWAKHPYVVLHELAHSYHDQVIIFNHPGVIYAYKKMMKNGSYKNVLLYNGAKVRHYAMTNHKEYFAESTESYLGMNDFYPFVRAELKEHDSMMFQLMEKFWGKIE